MEQSSTMSLSTLMHRHTGREYDAVVSSPSTQLYNRMFAWKSRKHIPVRDESEGVGKGLNAYLINPAYLDLKRASTIQPVEVVTHNTIPVYQYSRLTREAHGNQVANVIETEYARRFANVIGALVSSVVSTTVEVSRRVRSAVQPALIYSYEQAGFRKEQMRRSFAKFAVVGMLLGGAALFAVTMTEQNQNTATPRPAPISVQSGANNISGGNSSQGSNDAGSIGNGLGYSALWTVDQPAQASTTATQASNPSDSNGGSNVMDSNTLSPVTSQQQPATPIDSIVPEATTGPMTETVTPDSEPSESSGGLLTSTLEETPSLVTNVLP